jgi:DNA-binding HxlR family transcriptional regulator
VLPELPGTVDRALALLGDTWTLLILQRAHLGARRYAQWRDVLGISHSTLSGRLRSLTEAGLLATRPYRDGGRSRMEYTLTERGADTWSLLAAIWAWERRWVPREVPLPDPLHTVCGQGRDILLTCGDCHQPVGLRDTVTTREPGVPLLPALPARLHPRRTRGILPSDPLSLFPGAMEIIGDRWGTALLAAAALRVRTFSDFQRIMDVSPDVLTDRLRRFVAMEILDPSPKGGYKLTERGLGTFPILACLLAWADRWMGADGARPALVIRHTACGHVLRPVLTCAACGVPYERRTLVPSPPA